MNAVRCCLENVATHTSEYLLTACDILPKINILLSNNTSAARDILNTNYNLRSEVVQNR